MFAELYLTDGEIKIDLLGGNRHTAGLWLRESLLSRPTREPSGVFRQTYGAVTESYRLGITDVNHNAIARRTQQLDRLLEQAANYFSTNVENNLVWLVARTADESNPRYAIVYGGQIENYDDVYNQPFVGGHRTTMEEVTLGLERSTWQANPPLEPECVALTNTHAWNASSPAWSNVKSLANVQTLFVTATGSILAANQNIERSTDGGDNWTTELSSGAATIRFFQFIQFPTGRIYGVAAVPSGSAVSASGLWYSDDDGDTWSQLLASENIFSIIYRSVDGTLFWGGNGSITYVQPLSLPVVISSSLAGNVMALTLTQTGAIAVATTYETMRIAPGALTLTTTTAEDVGPFRQIVPVADYLLLTSAAYLSISRDDGLTWTIYWYEWGTNALYLLDNGNLVASENAETLTYASFDGGFTWLTMANTFTGNPIYAFAELGDAYLFAAANGAVWRRFATDAESDYGPYRPACDTPVYVANARTEANWTHIFVYDSSGTSYTAVTPADVAALLDGGVDQLAFPSPVGTSDALYIGISTALADAGTFNNIYINLTANNYTLTLAVEYWNGSAWTAMSTSELRDNTQSLRHSGLLAWHGVDMRSTAVNSVTAYWIRIRVTATGTLSTLLPKFNNIYIVNKPYVELEGIAGDIPALAQMHLLNAIDDGNGNAPSLPTNRIVAGLRSVERGARFTAFLNFASKQNPAGITATGTVVTSDTEIAAAGEYILHTPTIAGQFNAVASITLDTEIAHDFAGTYQVYLRYAYSGGDATAQVQLGVANFINQGTIYGDGKPIFYLDAAADFAHLVHLGQFSISPDRFLSPDDVSIGTQLTVLVNADGTGSGYAVSLFELILIPADEWIGEFADPTFDTIGMGHAGLERHIDIDSCTYPKRALRSLVRIRGSEQVTTVWRSSASGPFVVQPAGKQRLWMVADIRNEDDEYNASTWTVVHQVKLWHHARWLGLRGED